MSITKTRFLPSAVCPLILAGLWLVPGTCSAQTADGDALAERKADTEKFFRKRVTPFIKKYCLECHQNSRPTEAGLTFTPALDTPGHAAFSEKWKKAAARVKTHDMPPDGLEQPTEEERQMFIEWLDKVKYLSDKDPGPFVIRRLTKTEYANTLHDLFGVDPKVADALPDEVSGEGYLNSISPLQLEQYLSIAEEVLDQFLELDDSPPTDLHQRLIGRAPAPEADARATAREVAQTLAKKAYRRPASGFQWTVRSGLQPSKSVKSRPECLAAGIRNLGRWPRCWSSSFKESRAHRESQDENTRVYRARLGFRPDDSVNRSLRIRNPLDPGNSHLCKESSVCTHDERNHLHRGRPGGVPSSPKMTEFVVYNQRSLPRSAEHFLFSVSLASLHERSNARDSLLVCCGHQLLFPLLDPIDHGTQYTHLSTVSLLTQK